MSSPAGVDAVEQLLGHALRAQLLHHPGAALAARHQPHVAAPASRPARSVASSSRPWAATTSARSPPRGELAVLDVAPPRPRARARRRARAAPPRSAIALHEHPRRGQHRLEEHLDHPARQARVLHRHRALLALDLRGPSSRTAAIRSSDRLAGLERPQRVRAHAVLGADAADEALDRPVGEHERGVAGLDARRAAATRTTVAVTNGRALAASSCARRDERRVHHCGGSGAALHRRPHARRACRACRCGRRRASRTARRSPR